MSYQNIAKAKAIERKNKERLLEVNPNLDDESGIYFLTRVDDLGIKHAYVGLAKHLLTRLAQHLSNYQYIDNSIRKHGLYSEDNPYGYKVNFLHFPESQIEEKERYYITQYSLQGYQMKNRDTGGGRGKQEIGERKQPKGYYDGIRQGYKNASKDISHLFELHLDYKAKSNKPNKNQEKALEKFENFLSFHKGGLI